MARPKKTETPVGEIKMPIYQFKIRLEGLRPFVDRILQVPSDFTFEELHYAIQAAMGWDNSHLYSFGNRKLGYLVAMDEESMYKDGVLAYETLITDFFKQAKDTLTYTYDFGDSWEHSVTLEKIVEADPAAKYPVCVKGAGACPPEDCGGIWGYQGLLETINDPKAENYEDMREWMGLEEGDTFDPAAFDLEGANASLQGYFGDRKPSKQKKTGGKTTKKAETKIIQLHRKPLMVNISNSPYNTWSEEQRKAANAIASSVMDLALPKISAKASLEDIDELTETMADNFNELVDSINPSPSGVIVHIMGEMVFTYRMVDLLCSSGIMCYSSTSEQDGRFNMFRPYFTKEDAENSNQMDNMMREMEPMMEGMSNNIDPNNMGDMLSDLMKMIGMDAPEKPKGGKKKK